MSFYFSTHKWAILPVLVFGGFVIYYIPSTQQAEAPRTQFKAFGANNSVGVLPELRFYNSTKAFGRKYYAYLEELGVFTEHEWVDMSQPLPPVTIVSAVSENHAAEARSLAIRVAKEHPWWKIYIYDIGLKPATRKWFEEACNIELRNIDLARYNVHRNLFLYQWKPVIIATALKEFPVVFWTDTSTFFFPNMTLTGFVKNMNLTTDLEGPNVYLFSTAHHSTFAVTTSGMYDYLSPQGDTLRKQAGANKQLWIRTKSTMKNALKWWLLCGLEQNCIAPREHKLQCKFNKNDPINFYAKCHRYDQSAINLVLAGHQRSFLDDWSLQYMYTERGITAKEEEMRIIC